MWNPPDGVDGIDVNKAKFSTIPKTEIRTAIANRISLTALTLSLSCVLTACSSGSETPELNAALQTSDPATNSAPEILSMSLGCDLVAESVSIRMGDSAEFFLLVDDESPLDLDYVVDIQKPDIASVVVDSEGTLLVSGLTLGRTDLTVNVVDSYGLEDTVVVRIVVDL